MALTIVPARPTTALDLGRYCTAAERRILLGDPAPTPGSRSAHERAACERLGIAYHQRRRPIPGHRGHLLVDECEVWIDEPIVTRFDALARGAA